MANVAASLDPNLPFPFPTLEAELPNGYWKKLDVDVGAPCGKTKTILVDLTGKLPAGARRLRLTTAFEIYWDSPHCANGWPPIKTRNTPCRPTTRICTGGDYSEFLPLPDSLSLTPDYEKVQSTPPWRRTPSGWCTRYGAVNELVQKSDDELVLLNGGDELALSFPADKLPPKPAGWVRDFFLHAVGWDKDADFHVAEGWQVEPLPFHGMDDQTYGQQTRPANLDDDWIQKYNTRWVGPMILNVSQAR